MSDENEQPSPDNPPAAPQKVNLQDLVQDLNLVPTWARRPSSEETRYTEIEAGPDKRRDGRESRGGPRRDRPREGRDRDGQRRPGGPASRDRRDFKRRESQGGDRPGSAGEDTPRRRPYREERPSLPVEVSFIPDRDRLGAVVRQLHAVKRAFPLPYLANLFLVKPEYHMIKLEARPAREGDEPLQFFQCRETRMVFLSLAELNDYLVRTLLDRHFERVEQAAEPPSGNFVCVGQCRRTGIILGPPNYHGYSERLMEVHRAHFPGMSLDQYRNNIEMVRDPAVIEKWKEECRLQVRYRPRETPDAEASLTLVQAENIFLEKFASTYVQAASKVIFPASLAGRIGDERLKYIIEAARAREDRFPLSLMLALRPAFRRMRLHLFRAGKDETFVTAIPPKAFDAGHAIPAIKDMVALIAAHPGFNRHQLVEKLYPGKSPDDPPVVESLSALVWLVDKGHVIEFFNGTFAIPGHLRGEGVTPAEAPQEKDHPEVEAAGTDTVEPSPEPEDIQPEAAEDQEDPGDLTGNESSPLPP